MRIVSLLPSATEICFSLGLGQSLVGVTHECDFPPQAQYKPILTRSTLDHTGQPQAGIDHHVRQHRHQGSSLYALDLAALARVHPDLILTQELCDVCAVAYPQVQEAVRILPGRPSVISLEPDSLASVWRSIAEVGRVTGSAARARELIAGVSARVDAVRGAVAGRKRVRVVCIEWYDPIMVAGHWVPDQVEIAGGVDLLGVSGTPSRSVPLAEVAAADPDCIICMPCGLRHQEAVAQARQLTAHPGWGSLRAVQAGRVYAVDGSWYFNRPGPRVIDGIELLARILHPEAWRGPAPGDFSQL